MGLYATKKLLHSKGNGHQTEEATQRMGEKLFQLYICQGIKTRIYRELKKKKPTNPKYPQNLMTQ
jgi:hypothetical protein